MVSIIEKSTRCGVCKCVCVINCSYHRFVNKAFDVHIVIIIIIIIITFYFILFVCVCVCVCNADIERNLWMHSYDNINLQEKPGVKYSTVYLLWQL